MSLYSTPLATSKLCIYFGDYLERNFPEATQSPITQQLKIVSSVEQIRGLEQSIAGMIDSICKRPNGQKVHSSQLYALQTFCRQIGYSTPKALEQAIGEIELRRSIALPS
ncbi:MAG: hypothetical protein LLG04_09940 [Parachlamydia sp.]|nr:hypothetical protein [Parachlamydia sp.]